MFVVLSMLLQSYNIKEKPNIVINIHLQFVYVLENESEPVCKVRSLWITMSGVNDS